MGQAIQAFSEALERLRSAEVTALSSQELVDEVVGLRRLIDGIEVEWSRRVAQLDRPGNLPPEVSSPTHLLKTACNMAGSRAMRALTLGRRLADLPLVDKAFISGVLSFDQVKVFTDLPSSLTDALCADEAMLVEAVAPLTVHQTRRVVDYWRWAVDGPDQQTLDRLRYDERHVHASRTIGGMVTGSFLLDPLGGEVLLEALAAATPPPGDDDLRTPQQRRADALTDIARRFLDTGQAPGSEKPHLLVLTDLNALQGKGGGLHETVGGQVLSPETIRQIGCDSTITRVVFGPDSQPVDVGRATRIIPPAIRRAVIARDRHCQGPGCDRPARWCDIHHLTHWADGGPTAIWNLQLLCRYHHTRQHQHPPRRGP
jgi:hypothetical protein